MHIYVYTPFYLHNKINDSNKCEITYLVRITIYDMNL